jgi:cell division protein FtsB
MRVQFDLRPVSLLEKERKKTTFNMVRLLVVLLFIPFLASSLYYIVEMAWKRAELQENIEIDQGRVEQLVSDRSALEIEIRRLQDREKMFADTLKIMQDDVPTLEVLYALETNMSYGMGLNRLVFSPGNPVVVLEATAALEEQIIALTNGLSSCGVFSAVAMPISRRDEATGRVTFTLNLTTLPIGQIKAAIQ